MKKDALMDLPCYSSPIVQEVFRETIWEYCKKKELSDDNTEMVKILAPLTDNPNTPNENRESPIHYAAWFGQIEIVKILAHLTNNPNAQGRNGDTPIYWAALKGHIEIVKILAPLTNNPNAPYIDGNTPIMQQLLKEIQKLSKSWPL